MALLKICSASAVCPRCALISDEREIGIVLLTLAGDLLSNFERSGVLTLSKISVGEIEFHVVGIRICFQGRLKMLDGIVIQIVARKENADAGLRAEIPSAQLIDLGHSFACVVDFSQF